MAGLVSEQCNNNTPQPVKNASCPVCNTNNIPLVYSQYQNLERIMVEQQTNTPRDGTNCIETRQYEYVLVACIVDVGTK